jgi:hypothetical protein
VPQCQTNPWLSGGLKPVTESIVVTAFQPALLALAFTRFDQVFQTARALLGGRSAFGAPVVALHAELVLPLPRDFQVRELVLYTFSHFVLSFF